MAVKDNQSDLHAYLQRDFAYLDRTGTVAHGHSKNVERGHGLLERRTCTLMDGTHGLRDELDPDHRWPALGCTVRVVAERTLHNCTTRSVRDYISYSPSYANAYAAELCFNHNHRKDKHVFTGLIKSIMTN